MVCFAWFVHQLGIGWEAGYTLDWSPYKANTHRPITTFTLTYGPFRVASPPKTASKSRCRKLKYMEQNGYTKTKWRQIKYDITEMNFLNYFNLTEIQHNICQLKWRPQAENHAYILEGFTELARTPQDIDKSLFFILNGWHFDSLSQ